MNTSVITFIGITLAFLVEKCQRDWTRQNAAVIFDCSALFCMSLCASVQDAVATCISIFQPYTRPLPFAWERDMTAYRRNLCTWCIIVLKASPDLTIIFLHVMNCWWYYIIMVSNCSMLISLSYLPKRRTAFLFFLTFGFLSACIWHFPGILKHKGND
jgi:hypothetical protein